MVPERLPSVLLALEQHPQQLRIKKLIYFVSHRQWPGDRTPMELSHLVPLLLDRARTTQDLTDLLARKAAKLNKSEVYLTIAHTISQILGPLYSSTPSSDRSVPVPDEASCPSPTSKKSAYNAFDLKVELMQFTNPLKAKILAFSALYHPFSFSRQDWLSLKQRPLDQLVQTLLTTYPAFTTLEQQLTQTAHQLEALDQGQQVVHGLLRAIQPMYGRQTPPVPTDMQTAPKPQPLDSVNGDDWDLDLEDDLLTCQLFTKVS